MSLIRRRALLAGAAAGAAGVVGGPPAAGRQVAGRAPAAGARVQVDPARTVAAIDRRLFGSFLEHLGRAIYGGIYEPEAPVAAADGFRRDVMEAVRALGVPIVRYPGGNFVSGYNWLDGVGPKGERPRVLDRAWNSLEPNQVGTNEFLAWCRQVGTLPLLAVNLGTGTPESAAALVEYCNVSGGTRWSDLRRRHGAAEPHGVKTWCLGNEMDGPWQIGHMNAVEYGDKAADAARQMRAVDRSVELIACGSSGPFMATYLEWDRQVLERCYNEVDGISLHRYFDNGGATGGDPARFVALNLAMERQIEEVAATCDYVRGRLRSRKRLWLSFDEWNVWYRARDGNGRQQFAPPLLEEVYNLEDALLVGGIVNSLLRSAARVRIACLAQLVNVIAPLMTRGDRLLRQTIYYPYAWGLRFARGRVLDLAVDCPTYEAAGTAIPYLDVAGSVDAGRGESCLLMLNRDLQNEREVTVSWSAAAPARVLSCQVLTGPDLKAVNTFEQPDRVAPRELDAPRPGARMTFRLPPRSYTAAHLAAMG